MGHVWVGKYPARTLSTLAMDSDSCHAAEPSATLPVCVGGRGVHVGSGVDVGGGSGVDVRDGRGVDVGGGRGVQVAVGQTVDVADGSGSGTVVGVGVAAGDPLHAARIRTLRAASSSWRPRWTERQNPYVDRAKSNRLLAFSSRIVVEEHCGTVRSDASFETHVGAAARNAVQNPVRMVNSLELLHPGLNPRSRLESAIPPPPRHRVCSAAPVIWVLGQTGDQKTESQSRVPCCVRPPVLNRASTRRNRDRLPGQPPRSRLSCHLLRRRERLGWPALPSVSRTRSCACHQLASSRCIPSTTA